MIALQNSTLFRFGQRVGFVSAGVGYLFQDVSDRDKREIRKLSGNGELQFVIHDKQRPDRIAIELIKTNRPATGNRTKAVSTVRA